MTKQYNAQIKTKRRKAKVLRKKVRIRSGANKDKSK